MCVYMGRGVLITDLISGALYPVLGRDDSHPRKQLVVEVGPDLFERRRQVHDLVGDPELVVELFDLRIASELVIGGDWSVRVHAVVHLVLVGAFEHLRPRADACLESYRQRLLHLLVQLVHPQMEVGILVQAEVVDGLLNLVQDFGYRDVVVGARFQRPDLDVDLLLEQQQVVHLERALKRRTI